MYFTIKMILHYYYAYVFPRKFS